jgi:hypothetical protein
MSNQTQTSTKNRAQNAALLLLSLRKFYAKGEYLQSILPIVGGRSEISLRLIDFFITNYAKKHKTSIVRCADDGSVVHMNVFAAYRSQLKSYSKAHFDPFRRRDRLRFHYTKEDFIDTTIGQLNLFRWILTNDILEYIASHREDIERDMVQSQREAQQRKAPQQSTGHAKTSHHTSSNAAKPFKKGIVPTIACGQQQSLSSLSFTGGSRMILQFD